MVRASRRATRFSPFVTRARSPGYRRRIDRGDEYARGSSGITRRHWFSWVAGVLALSLAGGAAAGLARPETATVPLKIVPIGHGEVKIGVAARLGGGARRLYTFDTGSSGFYAAYNPLWWPSFQPVDGKMIDQHYGDDVTLQGRARGDDRRDSHQPRRDRGRGRGREDHRRLGWSARTKNESTWLDDVAAGRPPLFGPFYGDFGSGLTEKNGLFAVLPQLPGNLSSGFAVQLGCWRSGPALALGLTRAIRSRVTSWVPMQGAGQFPPFPHSNRPTYAQALLAGEFLLRRGGITYALLTDALLDTGAPTTNIHEDDTVNRAPAPHRKHSGIQQDRRQARQWRTRREPGSDPVLPPRRGVRRRAGPRRVCPAVLAAARCADPAPVGWSAWRGCCNLTGPTPPSYTRRRGGRVSDFTSANRRPGVAADGAGSGRSHLRSGRCMPSATASPIPAMPRR